MRTPLTVLMAQINPLVGAIEENTQHIIKLIQTHQTRHDLIVFPELAITGYPPEDLLFQAVFHQRIEQALKTIQAATQHCHVIIGHPSREGTQCYNAASLLAQGTQLARYYKQKLPNDGVFDEMRYFTPSPTQTPTLFSLKGYQLAVCICEDLWHAGPVDVARNAGAEILIAINASPFDLTKYAQREALLRQHAQQGVIICYVNQTGGQDELLFDGQSLTMDAQGLVRTRAPAFQESNHTIIIQENTIQGELTPLLKNDALMYQALVYGLREYVTKNHFPGVLLGLSGGIDSALALAIAVDALGACRVHAVMMPSAYTSIMSVEDAQCQLDTLQVPHTTLPITPALNALLKTLEQPFAAHAPDLTEENLQARIRGILLMALSNKTGKMLISTSNKSETAVGYTTLYGDMSGGFAVLKDVLKTQVYALARYRNSLHPAIPERVITRAPSAELRPNQTDQDSLPDYAVLDAILTLHMEHNLDARAIIAQGYDESDVVRILTLIKRNEYKRHQAPPGSKLSPRAFGRDWRYPITSGFKL